MRATTPTKAGGAPLDARELSAWRGLLRVHGTLIRELDAELAERHGLALGAYEVLLFLAESPKGRLRMSELADRALYSRSGLSRLVDRLERAGLLCREDSPEDARGCYAVLTPEGREAFRAARRTHLAGVRGRFLDALSDEQKRTLGEVWERVLPGAT